MNNLELSKDVYEKSAIDRAVFDFSDLSEIFVHEKCDYYECSFADCKYSITQTIKEFENYLIDLSYQTKYKNDNY